MNFANKLKLYLLLFSYLIVHFACNKHIGTYTTPTNYSGFGYNFKKDNTFTYGYSSCVEQSVGSGVYRISGDSLIINFGDHQIKRGSYEMTKAKERTDSIILNFYVQEAREKQACIQNEIKIMNNRTLIAKLIGDFDGLSQFKAKYNQQALALDLSVSYSFKYDFTLDILEPGEYSIVIDLYNLGVSIRRDEEVIYKIYKITKDKIVLGYFDWEEEYEFTLYRKKKKT